MKPIAFALSAALGIGLGTAAFAQQVVASDPQSVLNFMTSHGVAAKLTVDDWGDPVVDFRQDTDFMRVFFYGCTEGADCQILQFYSGFTSDSPMSLDDINGFNAGSMFVFAYLNDPNSVNLELDIVTGTYGVAASDFEAYLDRWNDAVPEFKAAMGF